MNAGALQPCPVRQVTTPCPYSAPTRKAPFFTLGTTPTQVAWDMIWFGIALSGVAMIASRTSFALAMRASIVALSSAAEADKVVSAIPSAQKIAKICFMFFQISRWDIGPHVTKFAAVDVALSKKTTFVQVGKRTSSFDAHLPGAFFDPQALVGRSKPMNA